MKAAKIIAWKNFTLHAPALAFLIALSLALSSCGALPLDNAGASGAGAEQPMSEAELEAVAAVDEDYDFSMFFGHSEDAITIGRIVERYKAATGISVKPIMTDEGAADDRLLQRYLSAADPPAAFALSADAEGSVAYAVGGGYVEPSVSDTTGESFRTPTQASQGGVLAYAETGAASSPAGIGWRFRGRGLAADRRMLADLIGAADADSAEVGAFIEDLRLSGYEEWDAFIAGLDAYIQGAPYGAITLNGKAYSFAAEKGRRSSQLNGVFAVRGAEYPFFSEWMMDLAAITSVDEGLRQARLIATPQAFASVSPIFDTYISAVGTYSSHTGGLYGRGVRGDDFVDKNVYSDEYLRSVFTAGRAVFMPLDSAEYSGSEVWNATQAGQLALFPVKLPYERNWLSAYRGAVDANKSLQMSAEYTLCVNAEVSDEKKELATAFVNWLAADSESTDAVQHSLLTYHRVGDSLPLWDETSREGDKGMVGLAALVAGPSLRQLLANPSWGPADIALFKDVLNAKWYSLI